MTLREQIIHLISTAVSEWQRPELFRQPLVGFSAADDPSYEQLKEIVGPWHLRPQDILPQAKTIVSFFIPFSEQVILSNRGQDRPSRAWAESYVEANKLINHISEEIISFLQNQGIGAVTIKATHTYAAAGTYNVSLTVSNAAGSNTYTGDNYITVSAAPVAPAAAFTANRTSGPAPLAVQFTDASTGGPAGWAWFFGDEKYDGAWTGANASAGWSARRGHSSVALPDGSIVLMGGDESFGNTKNDAWRSTDGGGNWTCVNASSGWTPRWNHAAVAMPDGSIILMGGDEGAGNMKNDTWRSTDNGTTWTCVNTSSGWTPRWKHAAVAMPDGSIILMGGDEGAGNMKNDTWRSTDGGGNWTRLPDAGWTPRWSHAAVALPDGSIVLMGGYGGAWLNDVWRLPYGETTWLCVNASSVWSARYGHTAVAMPDGSIVLMGGASTVLNNDAWRSTDGGGNWTCVNASSGWSRRYGHTAVAICRTGASYSWAGLTLPGT